MIGPTGAVRVMVASKPVDLRKGAEGLASLVRETMVADPFSGAVYVFRAKRADRIKLVFWDGTGLCLFAKRLENGIFRWPKIEDGVIRLNAPILRAGLAQQQRQRERALKRIARLREKAAAEIERLVDFLDASVPYAATEHGEQVDDVGCDDNELDGPEHGEDEDSDPPEVIWRSLEIGYASVQRFNVSHSCFEPSPHLLKAIHEILILQARYFHRSNYFSLFSHHHRTEQFALACYPSYKPADGFGR